MAEFWNYISIPFLPVDTTWPLPNFTRPHRIWTLSSAMVIPTVGVLSKIMANWLNSFTIHNRISLLDALDNRAIEKPLITVSNHYSCLDDPLLWAGLLEMRHLFSPTRMRWSLAAHDICFTNELHALFFSLGRTIPTVRGNGVYQRAMDFAIERLNNGEWIHIFPEGKVNMEKQLLRFKWGVGRLISECRECPIVIPMFHIGMDDILPNEPPYVPRTKQRVTVVIGKPIELEGILKELREQNQPPMEQRKRITDIIQEEVWKLGDVAKNLHEANATTYQE